MHGHDIAPVVDTHRIGIDELHAAATKIARTQLIDARHDRLWRAWTAVSFAVQFGLAGRRTDVRIEAVLHRCPFAGHADTLPETIRHLAARRRPRRHGIADISDQQCVRRSARRLAPYLRTVAAHARHRTAEYRRQR